MAGKFIKVKGVDKVIRNMLNAGGQIERNAQTGMKRAGLFIQRESQRIVPVQTGNLRASAFTRALGQGANFSVVVGYTASYAIFVHENLSAAHGRAFNIKHADKIARANSRMRKGRARSRVYFRRGANQQAKFLEKPVRENTDKIFKIISGTAGKKPRI